MFSSRRSDPTHSATGPVSRLAIAASAGVVMAGLLPTIAPGAAVTAVAHRGLGRVTYLGYSFEVPRGWAVINLDHHRGTCVRFDRHAVYLGTVPRDQGCPSLVVGTTEAMLIQPASRHAAPVSVMNEVTRRVTVIARGVHVTATFDSHPAEIDQILASAGLPPPVTIPSGAAEPAPVARRPPRRPQEPGRNHLMFSGGQAQLPANVTNSKGAASTPALRPVKPRCRPGAIRVPGSQDLHGGSDLACAQPNLTPSWLSDQAAAGWHFIPMYVGPQAASVK